MTKRERFVATMKHVQPDRPPFDFGGMSLTSYSDFSTIVKLAKLLDIKADNNEELKEKVLVKLDVDFRNIGFILNPDSPLIKISSDQYTDCWGVTRKFTGMYWDIVDSPLRNATMRDLDDFPWPDASNIDKSIFDTLREEAKRLYYDTQYVVIGEHPVYGVLELGCWMCGFDDFLCRILAEPEFVEKFCQKVFTYQEDVIQLYYGAIGEYIHLTSSGDDFGTQNGPFISEKAFRDCIMPWYKKRISLTKQAMKGYYFHHTCGSVYRLLDAIIEMGVDILNPVQPGAFEMDFKLIKQNYGDKLIFWGAIDEQGLLTTGTPGEVRDNVLQTVSILGKDGGYVVAPSHNIQPDVPAENILAISKALEELK